MRFISLARLAVQSRGYDYYKENRVGKLNKINKYTYSTTVKGSGNNVYNVVVNEEKPRSSSCDCPNANGRRVICKHLVAAYFKAHPDVAETYYEEAMRAMEEEDAYYEHIYKKVHEYVDSLSVEVLKARLIEYLLNDHYFVDSYLLDDYEY